MEGSTSIPGRLDLLSGLVGLPRARFSCAHRPALRGGLASETAPLGMVFGQQQRPSMPLAQLALLEQLNRLVGQIEQSQEVRHRDAAAPHALANRLAR